MNTLPPEADVLAKLITWGDAHIAIRAMLLTSSRARPGGSVDVLSDYDIILVVDIPEQFTREESWVNYYAEPMVRWGDESELLGFPTTFRSVIYRDYVKIDYTIWPSVLLQRVEDSTELPKELDEGYYVLIDKDGATLNWNLPTHQAFIPITPTEEEYRALVEEFWWVATYVAKSLWRGEFFFARWVFIADLFDGALRRMLEWRIEADHDWALRLGVHGRALEARLSSDMQVQLLAISEENEWAALWQTTKLFRQVAEEIAEILGFVYPLAVDSQVRIFLTEIQNMLHPE